MTDTSGEINLQSKQNIFCHLGKVKPATLAYYVADVIPFSGYVTFPSNPISIKPKKCISHTINKNNIRNIFRVLKLISAAFGV